MMRVLGLDIGGTKCAVLTADSGAEIELLKKIRFDTHTERGFEYARDGVISAATRAALSVPMIPEADYVAIVNGSMHS